MFNFRVCNCMIEFGIDQVWGVSIIFFDFKDCISKLSISLVFSRLGDDNVWWLFKYRGSMS